MKKLMMVAAAAVAAMGSLSRTAKAMADTVNIP